MDKRLAQYYRIPRIVSSVYVSSTVLTEHWALLSRGSILNMPSRPIIEAVTVSECFEWCKLLLIKQIFWR